MFVVGRTTIEGLPVPDLPNPSANNHLETRDCLIEAALTCFAKYGYDATSIRLISSMAGKNSSLISYYFGSKEGLYREVIRHLLTRFDVGSLREYDSAPHQPPVDAADAKTRLRAHIRRVLIEVKAHFHAMDPLKDAATRLFLSEIHSPKEEVKDLLRERLEPSVRELRGCIRALRPDFSGAEVDFWGITIHGSCISHAVRSEINALVWTAADFHLPLDSMVDRLTDFASRGLGQP
jgi:AcrR family transcriptional regulator